MESLQVVQIEGIDYIPLSLYEELKEQKDYYLSRTVVAEQNLDDLQEQFGTISDELHWIKGIIGNKSLQGNTKAVMVGVHLAMSKETEKRDGLARIYRQDVAQYAGCSEQSVSSQMKKLEENGLLLKRNETTKSDSGFGTAIYAQIPQKIYTQPDSCVIVTIHSGGVRVPECAYCHSTKHIQTIHRISYLCANPACTHAGIEIEEQDMHFVDEHEGPEPPASIDEHEGPEPPASIDEHEGPEPPASIDEHEGPEPPASIDEHETRGRSLWKAFIADPENALKQSSLRGAQPPARACYHCQKRCWIPAKEPGFWRSGCRKEEK